MPSSSSQPRAFSSSRAATQASVSPGTPSASLRASALPDGAEPRNGDAHRQPLLHCMAVIRCDNSSGNARLTRPAQPDKARANRDFMEETMQEF